MQYDATIEAAIAIRVQTDPTNPNVIYRVWTPSDQSYIVVDVFINGWMESQNVHSPGNDSFDFWRVAMDENRYPAWKW